MSDSVSFKGGAALAFGGALNPASLGPAWFSASATAGVERPETEGKGSAREGDAKSEKKEKGKDDSNIFLDNIGKIFLAAIGGVVLMLIRSSRGNANKTAARDRIESLSVLDPLEIDDLRVANSELTPTVWREIANEAHATFPSGRATYEEFVGVVRQVMMRLKGDAFTVQLGHFLDRVAIGVLENSDSSVLGKGEDNPTLKTDGAYILKTEKALPLSLLFTILLLCLNSNVKDRVKVLFEVMKHYSVEDAEGKVSEEDVVRMVAYLQQTCQLVPDAQIVFSDVKYPVQQYRRGNPRELVAGANKTMVEDGTKDSSDDNAGRYDEAEFHQLLRTKSVCAWGECYVKKRGLD
eukprot:CAMPEP_0113549954 /NCGR_PEP_ID=MMETSP0015_2-20120614/13720_1 /TAXON_ID=2838 /ORGANISM="Odontella" /LENGTH=350 /DNA_ID=CAMNT_0000450721 /DNA_START=268 /DNA_END=1321 /DNA_ORIENTATION=- /assembly_acc=CAM_ASM_000160